jgi:hypothetical protein
MYSFTIKRGNQCSRHRWYKNWHIRHRYTAIGCLILRIETLFYNYWIYRKAFQENPEERNLTSMEKRTRKPNHLLRKAGLLSGIFITMLLLPFAFGLLEGWFGVDYVTAWFAANAFIVGGFIAASIIPGIGEVADAELAAILAAYGEDGLILF